MQLYVSKMLPATTHRIQSIIAKNDKPVHLTSAMPLNSAKTISTIVADNLIAPLTQFEEDFPPNVASYIVTQPLLTSHLWKSPYAEDDGTSFVMKLLQPNSEFSEKDLRIHHASYHHSLREHRMKFLNVRIVIMTPIGSVNRFLILIVVPKRLRRKIFHTYNNIPMGVHMNISRHS